MYLYTCLCYFDNAEFEFVPESHKSKQPYKNKQSIQLYKGDVIIIPANLLHRGINYHKSNERKLLQIFNIYPINTRIDKLIHFIHENTLIAKLSSLILYFISFNQSLTNFIDYIHYYLVSNELQYKLTFNDLSYNDKKGHYISYIPGKIIMYNEEDPMIYDQNINIICDDSIKTVYIKYY